MSKANEAISKFKKVDISYDYSALPVDIKNALPHIKKAFDLITTIFMRQQMEGLPEIYNSVMAGTDEEKKEFFKLFKGPWDQLADFKSVYPEFSDRPATCAMYPADITKEEWDKTLAGMSTEEKELMTDTYTVIVRDDGKLKAVPYHVYYAEELGEIFEHLENAAECVERISACKS